MPLSLLGEYLYFLIVVALFSAPVVAVVLVFAWRRQRLARTAVKLALALPVLAFAVQVGWRADIFLLGVERSGTQAKIDAYLNDPQRSDVIFGALAGFESHAGLEFRRYRFPSLDGRRDRQLEIVLPPEGTNTTGWVRLVGARPPVDDAPEARLILKPSSVERNPAVDTAGFFAEFHPQETPEAYGQHSMFLTLYPGRSVVIHARQNPQADWRWVDAVTDLW